MLLRYKKIYKLCFSQLEIQRFFSPIQAFGKFITITELNRQAEAAM